MFLPEAVLSVIGRLEKAGYEAYAVGGCVRDHLLGRAAGDYDVTTSALPHEMQAVFAGERVLETGLKHGTLTVFSGDLPIEITTYRIDGAYADHRHPDEVTFTRSLHEDLRRRDFTVNAMAYSPARGLIDPFGGQADLQAGILRCVGDPSRRFQEDALRILRLLRFASVLGFAPEEETVRAAFENRSLLSDVSAERVFSELCRLLCGQNVQQVLCRYLGVLSPLLPEAMAMQGFDQRNPHHIYDVLEHTARVVSAVPPDRVLRLAAFFHDMGKPASFFTDADGVGHFYGHDAISADMAERVLTRLKCDTAAKKQVVILVQEHDVQIESSEKAVKRALNRLGPEMFFRLLALKRADNLAQAPAYAARQQIIDQLESIARDILAREACFSKKDLALHGEDLLAAGIPAGPGLGAALDAMLEAVINGDAENEKAALLRWLTEYKENHGI